MSMHTINSDCVLYVHEIPVEIQNSTHWNQIGRSMITLPSVSPSCSILPRLRLISLTFLHSARISEILFQCCYIL